MGCCCMKDQENLNDEQPLTKSPQQSSQYGAGNSDKASSPEQLVGESNYGDDGEEKGLDEDNS